MSLSPYDECVCGSGKKIKFCCPKNSLGEVEKIVEAINGDQRIAAIGSLTRLIAKTPDSLCLLSLKAQTQLAVNDLKGFGETALEIDKVASEDPLAICYKSLAMCLQDKVEEAVALLQDALTKIASSDQKPSIVGLAARPVVDFSLSEDKPVMALAHALIAVEYGNDSFDAERVQSLMMQASIPACCKTSLSTKIPDGTPWEKELKDAFTAMELGAFRKASVILSGLGAKAAKDPLVIEAQGACEASLGFDEEAIRHYRRLATMNEVPLQERIHAEAMAQTLENEASWVMEVAEVEWEVDDAAAVKELLDANDQFSAQGIPPAEEGQAPPLGAYIAFSQPCQPSSRQDGEEVEDHDLAEIDFSQRPTAIGTVLLFGRESDREPRIEYRYTTSSDDPGDPIARIIGDRLTKRNSDEVHEESKYQYYLDSMPFYNIDLVNTYKQQIQYRRQYADYVVGIWAETPESFLGDRSPKQVATQNPDDIALRAYSMLFAMDLASAKLEPNQTIEEALGVESLSFDVDFEERIPLTVLHLYNVSAVEDLQTLLTVASLNGQPLAMARYAAELMDREDQSAEDKLALLEIYLATRPQHEQLEALVKATKLVKAAGESPAMLLLQELQLRVLYLQRDECEAVLQELRLNHMEEPGVAQNLYAILSRFGLIDPRQMGAAAPLQPAGAPDPTPAADGKLWTPDQGSASEEGSKLWLPGDD